MREHRSAKGEEDEDCLQKQYLSSVVDQSGDSLVRCWVQLGLYRLNTLPGENRVVRNDSQGMAEEKEEDVRQRRTQEGQSPLEAQSFLLEAR